MPFVSKKLRHVEKKAEEHQKKKEAEERQRLEEEKRKEEEEKRAKHEKRKQEKREKKLNYRKEKELQARNAKMSEEVQQINGTHGGKSIIDEAAFERGGYAVIRRDVAQGQYSKLYKAKRGDNENMVVKITIIDQKCPKYYKENIMNQGLKVMRYVGGQGQGGAVASPQFVAVHDIFVINQSKIYVFMDECDKLSLATKIKAGDAITEDDSKKWCKQLAEGINALHSRGVTHRNIRPENIIFEKDNRNVIKLVGLNMCCLFWDSENQQLVTRKKFSPDRRDKKEWERLNHLPPEAFQSDEFDPSIADVWSWGVILCLLLTKQTPFDHRQQVSAEEQWTKFKESQELSAEAKQLLDKVFAIDVTTRATILDVLYDPWLRGGKNK